MIVLDHKISLFEDCDPNEILFFRKDRCAVSVARSGAIRVEVEGTFANGH